jgi:hypothetical protein
MVLFNGLLDGINPCAIGTLVFFVSLLAAFYLFANPGFSRSFSVLGEYSLTLGLDKLARLILIFANLFAFLVCLFSRDYIYNKGKYFSYLAFLLAFTNLEILSASATHLLEPGPADKLYRYVAEQLHAVAGRAIVLVNEYNASGDQIVLQAIALSGLAKADSSRPTRARVAASPAPRPRPGRQPTETVHRRGHRIVDNFKHSSCRSG